MAELTSKARSPSEKKRVRAAVNKKYPDMGDNGKDGLMNKANKK